MRIKIKNVLIWFQNLVDLTIGDVRHDENNSNQIWLTWSIIIYFNFDNVVVDPIIQYLLS